MQPAADHGSVVRRLVRSESLDPALEGHAPKALGRRLQALQIPDDVGLGRECPSTQEYDRDVDAWPLQLDQQIKAGLLQQDDDDVDIDGVAERAAITETPDDEAAAAARIILLMFMSLSYLGPGWGSLLPEARPALCEVGLGRIVGAFGSHRIDSPSMY